MDNFFDSNLLQTITIFVVGLSAFIIYKLNKTDEKSRAATMLMMEIREIEGALKKLLETMSGGNFYSSAPIIKENGWEKYKFIFIKYLDQDEYGLISEFYSQACRIEKERLILIKQIIASFEVKGNAMHESFIQVAKEKPDINNEEFMAITDKIAKKARLNTSGYQSLQPLTLMGSLLKNIKYVTTSTACLKIKKIARMTK